MLSFLHQVSVFSEELRRENVVFKIKTRSWCVSCQYKASISCSQRVRWGTLLNLGGIGMDYRGCRILAYWGSMCMCGGGCWEDIFHLSAPSGFPENEREWRKRISTPIPSNS